MATTNRPRRTLVPALLLGAAPAGLHADEPVGAIALEQIQVDGGTVYSRTESELVRPVHRLEGEALERRRAGTIGETLDGLPGVSNADFGPGVGRPVIRGLQGSRVEVLEDGLRTSDISGEGVDHVVASESLRATSVEYLRGPATLLYGSGAAGGVVNVVTGRFDPAIPERVSGRLAGERADNARERRGSVNLDVPVGESVALRGSYTGRRANDFDIRGTQGVDGAGRDGTLVNSALNSDQGTVTGIWSGARGFIGAGYSRWENAYGIPAPFDPRPRDEGGQDDAFERIDAAYDRYDLRGELYDPLAGFASARLNMAYTEFEQDEFEFAFERTSDGGVFDQREVEARFIQDEFDGRLELTHLPWNGLTGVVGLDYNHTDFVAEDPRPGRQFFIRPGTTEGVGLFAVEEMSTAFGSLEFGVRVDRVATSPDAVADPDVEEVDRQGGTARFRNDPGRRHFTNLSASLGAEVDLGEHHRLSASVTRAERAPSIEQLYAFGRHGAAGTFEVGDPDLSEERFLNFELALASRFGPVHTELTGFYNRVDDFIAFALATDADGEARRVDRNAEPDPDGELLVFHEQADAELYGLEAEATYTTQVASLPVTLRASGDLVRGRLRDGGDLPRMTPPRLGLAVETAWRRLDIALDYRRVLRQGRPAAGEATTAGYDQLGADLGWQPEAAPGLRVFLRGRNLTNAAGRRHQSFFRDAAPVIGRTVSAGLRYDF